MMGILNHDIDFSRTVINALGTFPAIKSAVESYLTSNGWVLSNDVLQSVCSTSLRGDINKGSESVNIHFRTTDTSLRIGQVELSSELAGLYITEDLSGLTYPVDIIAITDGDATYKGSFLILITNDALDDQKVLYAGLPNREHAQDNIKIGAAQTLSSGNLTVEVILPKDINNDYFYPDIYNNTKANFKPTVQARSATTANYETLTISSVTNINTTLGTADVTFASCTGVYGEGSLVGINPQPLILCEGLSGYTIENGSVEAITLEMLYRRLDGSGNPDPPGSGEAPDCLQLGYETSDASISGRLLGLRGIDTTETILDGSETVVWKRPRSEGKDRLWEVRINGTDKLAIPKTNYV